MGIIQDWIERDRKRSEAFQAVTNDELTADVNKANDYIKSLHIVESCCPLCSDPPSVKIRICEDHQKYLETN